jgi:hypothetical protein
MDREPFIGGSVAVLGGVGLGDSLIEMVFAQNALRCGYKTTIYSNVLFPLAAWFPEHQVLPVFPQERIVEELVGYDWIFASHFPEEQVGRQFHDRWVDYDRMCQDDRTQVENLVAISRQVLATDNPTAENGIVAPDRFVQRRFPNRVCLHPTSAEVNKNWLPERFLQLACRLAEAEFDVCFIMSAGEIAEWRPIIKDAYPLQGFADVADCAGFIYESGYFIGNDSGGAHLASCLGIPTVTIHGRTKKARKWKPGWGEIEVVTPRVNLIGSFLRQRYWKYFLPVISVERSFFKLVRRTA